MLKVLHANDDNSTLSGAFIIAWRVDRYLREIGVSYDYISMDKFDISSNAKFIIQNDSKTFGADYRRNRLIGLIKLPFYVYRVIKKNDYRIIHIDCDYTYKALLYAIPAKMLGARTIVHSHTTGLAGDYQFLKLIAHKFSNKILSLFTDKYIGCSKEAAEWLIPKKRINSDSVVFNGIDLENFKYNAKERSEWRKRMGLSNKFVIGNVGSICERKNQSFLVDVLYEVKKKKSESVLLLVGPGVDEYISQIKQKVDDLHLTDSVIFYGMTTNTVELLNVMDIFAFPSFVEGAPLALYEAEATGLNCVMSNTVSLDAVITNYVKVEPIDKGVKCWVDAIVDLSESNINREKRKVDEKYGLEQMATTLKSIYLENKEGYDASVN